MFLFETLQSALFLFVVPLAVVAHRLGWLANRLGRWVCLLLGAAAIVISLPWRYGLDLDGVKQINLLLCALATLLLSLRHLQWGWCRRQSFYSGCLAALALVATLNYVNYFSFHGARTFLQQHELAHYFIGARYFPELGYDKLYTAMLRADAELGSSFAHHQPVRDLGTNSEVEAGELLRASDSVKRRFSPPRWARFLADVEYFRSHMEASSYARIFRDHGFNATPFWTLIGGALAGSVPVANDRGLLLLALIDPFLLLVMLLAIGRVFGLETALLCTIFFTVAFGATFGWTGGAFLRHGWLFCTVLAMVAFKSRRTVAAGVLLAVATLLRIFPLAFAIGPAVLALHDLRRRGVIETGRWRFLVALLLTGLLGFGATALAGGGLDAWTAFTANTRLHLQNLSPNLVGATQLLAHRPSVPPRVDGETYTRLQERRQRIHRWQLLTLFPIALFVFVVRTARLRALGELDPEGRESDLQAAVMGIVLIFTALDLAGYYYVFLLLLVLAFRQRKRSLLWIFGAETLLYALVVGDLGQLEDGSARPFVYRSVLVAWTLPALYLPVRRRTGGC